MNKSGFCWQVLILIDARRGRDGGAKKKVPTGARGGIAGWHLGGRTVQPLIATGGIAVGRRTLRLRVVRSSYPPNTGTLVG